MKTVVSGGTGFLGRAVVQALGRLGVEAIPLGRRDGDLQELETARRLLGSADLVVHLAATVGGVGYLKSNKTHAYYQNLTLGSNVIDVCRNGNARRLVIIGTPCSYPADAALPLVEGAIFTGLAAGDTGPYGLAKATVTYLANRLLPASGKDVVTLIPANLYGPGDNYEENRSHVVASLIRKAIVNARTGTGRLDVWGDGSATRDFLHVDDAAGAIARAATAGEPFGGEIFNLASGVETSMRESAGVVAAAVDPKMKLVFDPEKPCGVPRRVMSIAKAAERLDYRPRIALADGIRGTVEAIDRDGLWREWLPAAAARAA